MASGIRIQRSQKQHPKYSILLVLQTYKHEILNNGLVLIAVARYACSGCHSGRVRCCEYAHVQLHAACAWRACILCMGQLSPRPLNLHGTQLEIEIQVRYVL